MPAQSRRPKIKAASPPKPLAWWKKLLIAVFGTYIAAKLFGILIPDVSAAGILPQTDEYPDDTWDYPVEDRYEDEDDLPPAEDLYDDWDDWNEGYDDDHFS